MLSGSYCTKPYIGYRGAADSRTGPACPPTVEGIVANPLASLGKSVPPRRVSTANLEQLASVRVFAVHFELSSATNNSSPISGPNVRIACATAIPVQNVVRVGHNYITAL